MELEEYDQNLVNVAKRAVQSEFKDDRNDMIWFVNTNMKTTHEIAIFCHFVDPDGPSDMKENGRNFDCMCMSALPLTYDSAFAIRHGEDAIFHSIKIPSIEWCLVVEYAHEIVKIYDL